MAETEHSELKNTGYEIFIGILSILSIFNLFLAYLIPDADLKNILLVINALLSAVFLIDFSFRLLTASSKSEYFFRQFGWADLLASLPLEQAKILRIFRLLRVFRLMREVGLKNILRNLVKDRAGSALLTLLLLGVFVLEFGSLAILNAEQLAPNGNIKTASDAIWYTIVTISTVGYGDRYPTTTNGRLIGILIIVIGVGIFGTFTGYLANLFLSPANEEAAPAEAATGLEDAQAKIEQLKQLLAEQQAALDEIDHMLLPKAE
jgi:voltage-gated potassium channel Kch